MDLRVHRGWHPAPGLLDTVRGLFAYGHGEDRATGYLYGDRDWPPPLADAGQSLLAALDKLLDVRFMHVAFQAYRNGAGVGWHTDSPFDTQAVLSLGATRTFGVRRPGEEPIWVPVGHGDLVVMPSGFQAEWEHCVPAEDAPGERISLVFRTEAR